MGAQGGRGTRPRPRHEPKSGGRGRNEGRYFLRKIRGRCRDIG